MTHSGPEYANSLAENMPLSPKSIDRVSGIPETSFALPLALGAGQASLATLLTQCPPAQVEGGGVEKYDAALLGVFTVAGADAQG